MILNEQAAKVFAQNAANMGNTPQGIYQVMLSDTHSMYIITHPNNLAEIKNGLNSNQRIIFIELIQPER